MQVIDHAGDMTQPCGTPWKLINIRGEFVPCSVICSRLFCPLCILQDAWSLCFHWFCKPCQLSFVKLCKLPKQLSLFKLGCFITAKLVKSNMVTIPTKLDHIKFLLGINPAQTLPQLITSRNLQVCRYYIINLYSSSSQGYHSYLDDQWILWLLNITV